MMPGVVRWTVERKGWSEAKGERTAVRKVKEEKGSKSGEAEERSKCRTRAWVRLFVNELHASREVTRAGRRMGETKEGEKTSSRSEVETRWWVCRARKRQCEL